MGLKPGDDKTLPGCSACHKQQHQQGERSFYGDKLERAQELSNALFVKTGETEYGLMLIARYRAR